MTRHTIILNSDQVREIQAQGRVMVREPIKYPIHSSWTLATVLLDGRAVYDEPYGYDVHYVACPFPPGSVLRVRETYWHKQLWGEPYYPGHYSNGEYIDDGMFRRMFDPEMIEYKDKWGHEGWEFLYGLGNTLADNIQYAVDGDPDPLSEDYEYDWIKRTAALMPSWASRYSVRVCTVTVEPAPWTWVVELRMVDK